MDFSGRISLRTPSNVAVEHVLSCFAAMEAQARGQWNMTTGFRLSYTTVHVYPLLLIVLILAIRSFCRSVSREEFEEAVNRFKGPDHSRIRMDQELRQMLFEWTMGHAGAVGDLLYKLPRVVSPAHHYRVIKLFPTSQTLESQ